MEPSKFGWITQATLVVAVLLHGWLALLNFAVGTSIPGGSPSLLMFTSNVLGLGVAVEGIVLARRRQRPGPVPGVVILLAAGTVSLLVASLPLQSAP